MADLSSLPNVQYDDQTPDALPEQGRSSFITILPQTLTFQLPADMMQCWEIIEEKVWQDDERKIPLMSTTDPTKQATIPRIEWKFEKDHPLVIIAPGNPELHEQPAPTVRISNVPRNRAKKGQPKILVADAMYLIRTGLNEPATNPLDSPSAWVHAFARHAGETFKAKTGLSAYCNTDKVRYIGVTQADNSVDSVEDPSGQKGCGKRYYTGDFKYQGAFFDRLYCQKGKGGPAAVKDQGCGAYLRGFFTIEEFLPRQ